jgi:hypothetical protein
MIELLKRFFEFDAYTHDTKKNEYHIHVAKLKGTVGYLGNMKVTNLHYAPANDRISFDIDKSCYCILIKTFLTLHSESFAEKMHVRQGQEAET